MPIVIPVPYQGESRIFSYADTAHTNYFAAVEAAGGTVSTAARNLLSTVMNTAYNGLKYDFYKSKLRFFWCPLSNFAGIGVPIKGPNFSNVGYVSGDYSINSGLQGGTGKFLNTGVLPSSEANNNTTMMAGSLGSFSGWLIGGGISGQFAGIGLGGIDAYNNNSTAAQDGRIILTSGEAGIYFGTRNSPTNFTAYRDETLIGTKTGGNNVGTLASSNPIYIGNLNIGDGTFTQPATSLIDCASWGSALTRAEEISFSRMINAIRAGRAAL